MTPLKVGLIGLGVIGKHHANTLRGLGGAKLTAVADVNISEAKNVGSQHRVNWYVDFVDMLEKEELDIASVCVPHFLHEKVARDVAKHGVNVVLEKPIAMRIKEADRIIKEARRRGVKLGVVFQHRFRPTVSKAKRLIDDEVAPLFRCSLEYGIFRGSAYYRSGPWRGTWTGEGGGVLINQGIHYIDLLQFLVGARPSTTFALASTVAHDIQVEDLASAVVNFQNDVQGVMQLSTVDVPALIRTEFRGNGGIVALSESEGRVSLNIPSLRRQIAETRGLFDSPRSEWKTFSRDPPKRNYHVPFYKDFIDAVIEDREPRINGEEGRKSLELANGVTYSAATGKPVNHPLDPDKYERLFGELTRGRKLIAQRSEDRIRRPLKRA